MWTYARRTGLTCIALALVTLASPASIADVPNDPFEGEWSVTATPDAQAAADGQGTFDEALLFHEGQFSAAVFAMFGFTPAQYAISTDNGQTTFIAQLSSNDRGTLTWVGSETPSGFAGSLVWTRPDASETRYRLIGTRE